MVMKKWLPLTVVLCGLGAAALCGVWRQERIAREFEAQASKLRDRIAAERLDRSQASKPGRAVQVAIPGGAWSEEQKLELAALRGQVSQMRQQLRDLGADGGREENARLKARLASLQKGGQSAGPKLPKGFVRRSEARNLGFATAESTLESFFWALEHKDTNVLFQAMNGQGAEELRKMAEAGKLEELWRDIPMPGFAIQQQIDLSPTNKQLQVSFGPEGETVPMKMELVDGQWRMSP